MRLKDKTAIDRMRMEGRKASEIAATLGISINTIRSHIRRHPEIPNARNCFNCGIPVLQLKGRKVKKFCSDHCRMAWWNSHSDLINKKSYYTLVCHRCGKEFKSYGNKDRKYCCRDCYVESKRQIQSD